MTDVARGSGAPRATLLEAKWDRGYPNVLTISDKAMLPMLLSAQAGQVANGVAR